MPAWAPIKSTKIFVYRFDQPMRRADTQSARTPSELVIELSHTVLFQRLIIVDPCDHRSQQKWTY